MILIVVLDIPAPDVGVEEEVAQFYFNQLIAGLVILVFVIRLLVHWFTEPPD